jgi:putative DNA primase/helicase
VLKGRKLVREGWRVPTLIIDANLNPDLVRPFWPFYTTTVDLAAPTPHQRTRQVVDRSYSKRHLGRADAVDPAEKRSGHRHLQQLAATLDVAARQATGRGALIVANKEVEDALASVWLMPPGVDTAHFNAVAGRDGWPLQVLRNRVIFASFGNIVHGCSPRF